MKNADNIIYSDLQTQKNNFEMKKLQKQQKILMKSTTIYPRKSIINGRRTSQIDEFLIAASNIFKLIKY